MCLVVLIKNRLTFVKIIRAPFSWAYWCYGTIFTNDEFAQQWQVAVKTHKGRFRVWTKNEWLIRKYRFSGPQISLGHNISTK